ncbi:hypothetical protein ACEPVM_16730 [Pseudomonas aeruginosa]|uniref:hypothetical protein n=5 Tax=Pseudomonas aeruginosa TaxID=287 RepID=UPI001068F638|nr:hypothetical protein [Pseudomonas aeruginosa]UWG57407.1 hypothetical protein NOQ96_10960 [Pseudomonas aeruginosa]
MNKANECTCPSGDGSLVHPCPAHPAVEQAGGDRWDALQSIMEWTAAENIPDDRKLCLIRNAARAALAQPSPMYDPKRCLACGGDHGNSGLPCPNMRVTAQAQPSPKCVKCGGTGEADSGGVHPWGEPVLIPCDCETEQAVAERPEVVAYADPVAFATFKERGHEGGVAGREWMWAEPGAALVAMSRTDECERIVGALREQYECNTAIMHARTEALSRVTSERDAALSRVAELEKQEPVATVAKVPGEDWNSLDFHRDLQDMQPGTKLYAAPLAQAQQLHDLDKQCRDDVARALGLRPNQERGFAWSYLLASIKSCVKASEDSAQAQHSVPEGVTIERDVAGTIHIKVGDFDFIQLQYQRPYTDNASTWKLAERIASLLAAAPGTEVPQAWLDVQAERRRQITAEGWTPDHDDLYCAAELPRAAAAYILSGANDEAPAIWPFSAKWWKPRDARSNYVRAGALILAEIERLDRAAPGKEVGHE